MKSCRHAFLFILFAGLITFTFDQAWTALPQVSAESVWKKSKHFIYGEIGLNRGGLGLGGDYEMVLKRKTFGLGGFLRIYSKDNKKGALGLVTFGGFIRPHFYMNSWDLFFSPGFGLLRIDSPLIDDATTIGPSFSTGLQYQLLKDISLGIEIMKHYAWFSSDFRGMVLEDFMIKGRYNY